MTAHEELFVTLPMFDSLVMDVYIIHIIGIANMPILARYGNLITKEV